MQLYFHLFRHPSDGLSLLCQELGALSESEAAGHALLWGLGSPLGKAPRPRGSAGLAEWSGLTAAGRAKLWRALSLTLAHKGRRKSGALSVNVPLLLLACDELEGGLVETLERVRREPAGTDAPIGHVALSLEGAPGNLPPLREGDQVRVYWEVQDILTDEWVERLESLAELLEESQAEPAALELYSRWHDLPERRLQRLCEHLKRSVPETLRTCREATWAIV